ncbi:MAG: hypothetical protein NVS3B25_07390 [Hymenobacter sp.]
MVGVSLLVAGAATLRACSEGGRYQQAVRDNPPLPKRVATVLRRQARKDSVKAAVATRLAGVYHQRADSALHLARTLTHQADSAHALYKAVPAAAGGPLPAVVRFLSTYTSPDTTRY